jgi:CRISPR-associated protein Csb2
MSQHLCITIRFHDGLFHGRRDGGEPEWPPSPLRAFQALVAAAAAQTNERNVLAQAAPMLRWVEAQSAPMIAAPFGRRGGKYRLYVPDNVGDLVARSWRRGNSGSIADYRTEKDVHPMRLEGEAAVHYLWPLAAGDADFAAHRSLLEKSVCAITHLGWGVDMVVANAAVISEEEAQKLPGRRWMPTDGDSRNALRVPIRGTLHDLNKRYAAFLQRARPEGFQPVPPLAKFRLVSYLTGTEPPALPFAAFTFLTPNADGMRPFDPVRNGMRVAGMMRHAAGGKSIVPALDWTDEKVRQMIHGHAEPEGAAHQPTNGARFGFIPVPSIEPRGKGSALVVAGARRALLLGMRGAKGADVQQLARLLAGQALTDERAHKTTALLARLPDADSMIVRNYTGEAATWATVTPVILPGYDDPKKLRRALSSHDKADAARLSAERKQRLLSTLDRRTDFLLRKAIRQAGFPDELARHAQVEWSNTGFWPGTDLAARYAIPATLRRFRRLHARIQWRDASGHAIAVGGPICIGGGRFVGLGLFAAVRETNSAR